jgi:cardiolipin synthase (CMP-forming)
LVLAEQGFGFNADWLSKLMMALVALLTLLSIAFYLAEWVRHMNSFDAGRS